MKTKQEEEYLALLYSTLKTRRKKTGKLLLKIVKACTELSKYYESNNALAKKLDVSVELIRAFVSISKLPKEVLKLIEEEKINFDVAQRLNRLDKKIQIKVANMVTGLNTYNARDLIQYGIRFPYESFEEFKNRLSPPKKQTEKYKLLILPIENELFDNLKISARQKNLTVEKFIIQSLKISLKKG